ncbi:MAG TPA: thioesterase family protein, partial [Candidatus Acidoferrum sp.]|nr:thioesterase family protein [Candidatus Acidoferrum sp.]
MSDQLRAGMVFEKTMIVSEAETAKHLAGKGISVLSTPELVRFVEVCALEGVLPFLQPNQNTVGTRVDVRHMAATPIGMKVTARCSLVEIDRRRLAFTVEVHDELEKVGEGTHERFIVDGEKHQQRIAEKLARWK